MSAPFQNCTFRECDLPGQCIGEGKCHHPSKAVESLGAVREAILAARDDCPLDEWDRGFNAGIDRGLMAIDKAIERAKAA